MNSSSNNAQQQSRPSDDEVLEQLNIVVHTKMPKVGESFTATDDEVMMMKNGVPTRVSVWIYKGHVLTPHGKERIGFMLSFPNYPCQAFLTLEMAARLINRDCGRDVLSV